MSSVGSKRQPDGLRNLTSALPPKSGPQGRTNRAMSEKCQKNRERFAVRPDRLYGKCPKLGSFGCYISILLQLSPSRRGIQMARKARTGGAPPLPTGDARWPTKGKRCALRKFDFNKKRKLQLSGREFGRKRLERQKPLRQRFLQVYQQAAPRRSGPGVFQSLLEKRDASFAGAKFGTMHLLEGDMVSAGLAPLTTCPPAYAERALGDADVSTLIRKAGLGQVIRTKQVAQIADYFGPTRHTWRGSPRHRRAILISEALGTLVQCTYA